MIQTISVPSKTFLLGEYLVLNGGPAILLNTMPRFTLTIVEDQQEDEHDIFHKNSPAGRYLREHKNIFNNTSLHFDDPYHALGGFGTSSAQFVTLAIYRHFCERLNLDVNRLIAEYQNLSDSGKFYQPSGADIASQIYGDLFHYCKQKNSMYKFIWPFYNLCYAVIHTNNKVKTHEHLKQLNKVGMDDLNQIVNQAIEGIEENDVKRFCNLINYYHDVLEKKGLIHTKTQVLIHQIRQNKMILASKGCGALGADAILLLFKKSDLARFKQWARSHALNVVVVGQKLSSGFTINQSNTINTTRQNIITVDDSDKQIGLTTKMKAHKQGILHRAFSIFIFRRNNNHIEVLLQKRARSKYHCGGLWSNTCCSHARPGEEIFQSGSLRLKEEFGFITNLYEVGAFKYYAELNNQLIENEYDHVLIGKYAGHDIRPDPNEIDTWQWLSVEQLKCDLKKNPRNYTPWLQQALELALQKRYIVPLLKG